MPGTRSGYKRFIENYFQIVDKKTQLVPFRLNEIQDKFLMEDASMERDVILKARKQGFCVDPKTKVLKADLTWVSIDRLSVGDRIVSVEETPEEGRGKGRKLKTAIIEAKRDVFEKGYKIIFESGKELIATGDHRFMSHIRSGTSIIWRKTKKLKIGDEIRFITDLWGERTLDDAWMGGMIDGEAHFRRKKYGGVELCVCQLNNNAWEKMLNWAETNKFSYRVEWDNRAYKGKEGCGKLVFNRINELFKIMGKTRPVRHIEKEWWVDKNLPGKRTGVAWDKIIKITEVKKQRMVDLQTSEKTFIANGYVSHNSSLILAMFTKDFLLREFSRNVIVADTKENSEGLLDRVKLYIESYEEKKGIKIPMKYNTRYELYNEAMKSKYYVGTAQNVEFGRSKDITNLHFSECAFFPDLNRLFAGAMQALTDDSYCVLETTANGWNHFRDFWFDCKAGKRNFKPTFYSRNFYPQEFLERKKAELKELFVQEYPENDAEAFLASGETYFAKDALDEYIKHIKEPIKTFKYGYYDFI